MTPPTTPSQGERDSKRNCFSGISDRYRRFRPCYPAELFAFLAGHCGARDRAWDAGSGNGQAARGLAREFRAVVATDASREQLSLLSGEAGLERVVCAAEAPAVASRSVDLATAGQAAHWFDLDRYYAEVRRVLRPGGRIALWCYGLLSIDEGLDVILRRFYHDPLGPYWPPGRRLVEERYETLPFPFREIPSPRFEMTREGDLAWLLGFLGTWSAVVACRMRTGRDPVAAVAGELAAAWGDPAEPKRARWPIHLRFGG